MKLCLTIGVSKAQPLSYLPGAITAAHEMRDWALQAGFITEMITDEDNTPVTINRIRQILLKMLPPNDEVNLFILHFAGHGFRSGAEQNVWLPSDWHQETRGISVEALKRQLYRHGVKSLSIFSDACRSLPSDIETADIFGDPVLPRGPYEAVAPIIDRFNAVADGQQAYMLKGDGNAPARCVFSTVLVEGLIGSKHEAFDKYLPDCVIPDSLASFSKKRLKEIGEIYDLKFSPEYSLGSPREHAIYFQRGDSLNHPPLPKWPEPSSRDQVGKLDEDLQASPRSYKSRAFKRHFEDALSMSFSLSYSSSNLHIRGAVPKKIWSIYPVEICSIDDEGGAYLVRGSEINAVQILVEFDGGVFASAVVYENLITLISRDKKGEISWTCVSKWFEFTKSLRNTSGAIANLQAGNLSAEEVDSITMLMREEKHINPILGAIASYLYDYAGDIDSIRRMAFFYCHYNQPIPFDVAFVGLLLTEVDMGRGRTANVNVPPVLARPRSPANDKLPDWATRETNEKFGQVAGFWPWLRQGWEFVEDPEPQESVAAEGLRDVVEFLLPSQFSSFKEAGARILIEKFHMEANK